VTAPGRRKQHRRATSGLSQQSETGEIAGIELPSEPPLFLGLLGVHILVALTAVAARLGAMLRQKRRGAHSILAPLIFGVSAQSS
jgi:hypothetical protein